MPKNHCSFINNSTIFHFVIEIVALAGALANPGKNGVTGMFFGNVANQLLHNHGFASTGTTERRNFATPRKRSEP